MNTKTKTMLCAATLAATLGIATDALAGVGVGVGEPTGTYNVSGRNYGPLFSTFGAPLRFESEYGDAPALTDDNFTGDAQVNPSFGTGVALTFDGVGEVVNEIEFNESYEVWDPSSNPVPTGHNITLGVPRAAPLLIPDWDTPSHLVEFSIRDTLGNLNSGGGINRDIFSSAIFRMDDIKPDGTTPSGDPATPLFSADRHPTQNDPGDIVPLDGNSLGFYIYFELNGVPANPAADLDAAVPFAQGDHPTKGAAQQVYYIGFSDSQADEDITHDIGPGTFGFNGDTERELDPGFNMINVTDALGFDGAEEIDTIVWGMIYKMIADGDGDMNGKVDGLDYLRWATNFGTTPVNDPLPEVGGGSAPIQEAPSPDGSLDFKRFYGDYDNSGGPVDGLDYLAWAANFGFVGDGSDTLGTAVPEPGTFALACFAFAGMAQSIRRRR